MIAYVEGILAEKTPSRAVIDVGGVGYDLAISLTTYENLPAEGTRAKLLTLTAVREDSIRLYGFYNRAERELFRLLLAVPGVGPKLALAVLSALPVDRFRRAVRSGDTGLLVRVPGIGKKSAERLVVELRGRFEKEDEEGAPFVGGGGGGVAEEARLALEALGFKPDKAAMAVEKAAAKRGNESATVEELVREALGGG